MGDTIDKQTFLAAIGCRTAGWYARRQPKEPPTPGLEWQFYGGNEVGRAARVQLGEGLMLPRSPQHVALDATLRALATPAISVLFEATFRSGALIGRADVLRRAGAGWDLIEVKSGKEGKNGEVKDEYLDDLSFTALVIQGSGVPINRCSLMLLSREYRLGAPGDLLVEVDVTDAVLARVAEYAGMLPEIVQACLGEEAPPPELKLICRKCAFFESECLGRGIEAHIFMLPGLSEKRLAAMKPLMDLRLLSPDADLTDNQRRVFDVIRSGEPLVSAGLTQLEDVTWPAYYLDFETVSPTLPWFDHDGTYEQHPFQFSVHVCDAPGHGVAHHEYLAACEGDWRRDFAERLLDVLGDTGSVVVYTDFEKKVLNAMAERLPDLAERIGMVVRRIFDLHAVVKNGYCHPGFQGRTSIKKVLPVMVPELAYEGMTVSEGDSASGVFGLMRVGAYHEESFEQHRRDLLEYCKLDTLAMVRVHEELLRILRSDR
jgi:Domain of unknown function(DUF2779)